jgi:hypothetical protein
MRVEEWGNDLTYSDMSEEIREASFTPPQNALIKKIISLIFTRHEKSQKPPHVQENVDAVHVKIQRKFVETFYYVTSLLYSGA